MTHTALTSVLAKAIYDKLNSNATALGLKMVLFGEQLMVPKSPVAVVTPGIKRRVLAGVSAPGGRTLNMMDVYIDIHSSKVGNEAEQRLAVDQLADAVETYIHQDTTVGGIIIHGYINQWDPGTTFFGNSEFRSVRLTFTGQSKTYLSS